MTARQPLLLVRRLRRSPRLAIVRRHIPAAVAACGALAGLRGRRRSAMLLGGLGIAGFVRNHVVTRRHARVLMDEHMARMRRLRRSVLQHFYITCIGSMEMELEEFPRYDQEKHEMRYEIVADLAARFAPDGGTVVDVGCASAMVLDRVHERRATRGIGFDLSPNGVRQRRERPDPPVLAQAVVEHIPLRDGVADLVVFSEVIEHLVDAAEGMAEVGRITKPGGHLVLTTNNASEMPVQSPLDDPVTWVERLAGRRWPRVLAFRNITWFAPINREADPLPDDAPTYAPHIHYAAVELRRLAALAGFTPMLEGSFEFPAPQARAAEWLRRLVDLDDRLGTLAADAVERVCATLPGINLMGTHNLMVFRKDGPTARRLPATWWDVRFELAPDGASAPG